MIPLHDDPDVLTTFSCESGEIAWAAGLFEGEGCFTLSAGHPRAKLNSTDEDTVRRFHEAVCVGQVREDNAQRKFGLQEAVGVVYGSKG